MLTKDVIRESSVLRGTADPAEIERFNMLAQEWWKTDGKFRVLHAFNAARVGPVQDALRAISRTTSERPLSGLRVADIGCGAGLVTEHLAQAGASVVAIDASETSIAIARQHARDSGLSIDYRCALPEALLDARMQFDAVVSLEVVEHVANSEVFLRTIGQLVRPGGRLIIGTLNRTVLSWLLAIVAAEYVLRWLPQGTHAWSKFVRPRDTSEILRPLGFAQAEIHGIVFNPMRWDWQISRRTPVNYLQVLDRKLI